MDCGLEKTGAGLSMDAAGNLYHIWNSGSDLGSNKYGAFLRRTDPSLNSVDLARIYTKWCYGDCTTSYTNFSLDYFFDVTNGRILVEARVINCLPCGEERKGFMEISGLPTMFDVLLTYVPQTSSLNLLTPAHPEGFRNADAFQVWAGDVATLPDWSKASPVECRAATNPVAGSLVHVADTLPSPTVGHASYYVVASQSGQERRLGRQALGGRPSARDATTLPACP